MDFEQIPGEWAVPGSYTEVRDVSPPGKLAGMPLRCIVIGQLGAGATASANTVYSSLIATQAAQLLGVGSAMAQAVSAFTTEQPTLTLDVIGVSAAANSTAAAASIKFSGAATSGGTAVVQMGGYRVAFTVAAGMAATDAAAAFVAACNSAAPNAQMSYLTAATGLTVSLGTDTVTVTVTSADKGLFANDFDIRVSTASADQVAGLTIVAQRFSGGAGVPDLTLALQALGGTWYTDVILLLNDPASLAAVAAEAVRRADAMVAKDMRVWVAVNGTQSQLLALTKTLPTTEEIVLIGQQAPRWSPWVAAAIAGAQGAQSLNTDPARQLRGIKLAGLAGLGPDAADEFSPVQRNVLLHGGCATLKFGVDGAVSFERVVTMRQVDPRTGNASGPWDVMIPAIGARVRYETDAYFEEKYYNAKLADDGSPLASAAGVVTCRTLKASWVALCLVFQARGWIDAVETVGPQAVFERDASDRNRVNSTLPIKPMGSLIVLANILQLQV